MIITDTPSTDDLLLGAQELKVRAFFWRRRADELEGTHPGRRARLTSERLYEVAEWLERQAEAMSV